LTIRRFAVLLVKYGLLLAALMVTAGVSALTTMRAILTSQEVQVPTLIGRRVTEAGMVAERQRLSVRVEGRRHDPKVPVDRIAAQEPAPGSTLKSHRTVRVWVSLGARRLTVPVVEGDSLRSARLSLEQAQVGVGRVVEVDDPAGEGTILVQHPPAGETDSLANGVSLLVSRGSRSKEYVMPDLIGKSTDDVLDALRRAQLKVPEIRYRSYTGVMPGTVLRQAPAAGYRVTRETAVSLEVSRSAE
jgi:eukaryotic-like serine/threonine-protein kinase